MAGSKPLLPASSVVVTASGTGKRAATLSDVPSAPILEIPAATATKLKQKPAARAIRPVAVPHDQDSKVPGPVPNAPAAPMDSEVPGTVTVPIGPVSPMEGVKPAKVLKGRQRVATLRLEFDGGSRGNPGTGGFGAVLRQIDTGQVVSKNLHILGR